jgi:hypothetical protein
MYSVIGGVRTYNLPCITRVHQIVHNHTRTMTLLLTDDTIFVFAFIQVCESPYLLPYTRRHPPLLTLC